MCSWPVFVPLLTLRRAEHLATHRTRSKGRERRSPWWQTDLGSTCDTSVASKSEAYLEVTVGLMKEKRHAAQIRVLGRPRESRRPTRKCLLQPTLFQVLLSTLTSYRTSYSASLEHILILFGYATFLHVQHYLLKDVSLALTIPFRQNTPMIPWP